MNIQELLQGQKACLSLNMVVTVPKEYYQNTDILALEPLKVTGSLRSLDEETLWLVATFSSVMTLTDAVSLEPVLYPFTSQIEENVLEKVKKGENTLDILSVLWENTVLEVPIRFSKVEGYENMQGDGWRLISEDDYKEPRRENPFQDLLAKMEEE